MLTPLAVVLAGLSSLPLVVRRRFPVGLLVSVVPLLLVCLAVFHPNRAPVGVVMLLVFTVALDGDRDRPSAIDGRRAGHIFTTDRNIKMIGLGMASAILVDALIIRTVLVPAIMHTLGKANWQLPATLERRLPRLKLEDDDETSAVGKGLSEPSLV